VDVTGETQPYTPEQAKALVLALIEQGYLVGVEVFGTDSFGLSDVFGPWSVGSDCNRAEKVLMRVADVIDFTEVHDALVDEKLWRGENRYPPAHFGSSKQEVSGA
jgi:hypothetical protein